MELWHVRFSSLIGVQALCQALSVNIKTWKSFQLEGPLLFDEPALIDDCELEALSHALIRNPYWQVFRYRFSQENHGELISVAKSLQDNTVWRVFDLHLGQATKHVEKVAEGLWTNLLEIFHFIYPS